MVGWRHAVRAGKAESRRPQWIERGQIARATRYRMELCQQAGQSHRDRCRIAAGDRVPERHRVPARQQRLPDLFPRPDHRHARPGEPPGDAQFPLHPGHLVGRPGDPYHHRRAGQPEDRVLTQPEEFGAVAA